MAEDESTTNCNRPDGYSTSEIVLTGCLSFLAGISAVLLFILIMKWKAERKLCFREKEEPFRGKWEGASKRATIQVLKKHTLESSKSSKGKQSSTDADPSQVESSVQPETDFIIVAETTEETKRSNPAIEQKLSREQASEDKDMADNNETSAGILPETPAGTPVQQDAVVSMPVDELPVPGHQVDDPTRNVSQDSPVVEGETIVAVSGPLNDVNTGVFDQDGAEKKEDRTDEMPSNQNLKAEHLFEQDRDSSWYDHSDFIIRNDNFRISVLSAN